MCDSYVYVVQRRYIFGVLLVRFRARVYEFLSEVLQCCLTRNCGVFVLLYVMSNVRTNVKICLLYTSPSPRDKRQSRMPSSA